MGRRWAQSPPATDSAVERLVVDEIPMRSWYSWRPMTVPAARRDPHLRRHPLRRLRLPMAGGNLSLVVPAGTLDPFAWVRAAAGSEPPYWAQVWPAAVAIARWLARRRDLAGRTVLDLGCGLGVPGAAAARAGARVTFADRDADALAFARFNAAQNCTAGASRPAAAADGDIATELHDWHGAALPGTFDCILLADVSYRPVHHAPLLRQVRAGLGAGGLAVHADPFRRESDGFLVAAAREFVLRQRTDATFFDGVRRPVRLTFLAREAAVLDRWLGPEQGPARAVADPDDGRTALAATEGR